MQLLSALLRIHRSAHGWVLFSTIVGVVVLVAVGAIPAVAQAQSEPTFEFGEPSLSNVACPDAATLSVPYVAESANGLDSLDFFLVSEQANVGTSVTIIFGLDVTREEATFTWEFPPTTPTSEWELAAFLVDSNGQSTSETILFDVTANPGCESEKPAVELGAVSVSNPVCPEEATVSANLTIDSPESFRLDISVIAVDPEGRRYPSEENYSGFVGADERFSTDVEVTLPSTAQPGAWELVVEGTADLEFLSEQFRFVEPFEVERGAEDCADTEDPTVAITAASADSPCFTQSRIDVEISASDDQGLATLAAIATSPSGAEFSDLSSVDGVSATANFSFYVPSPQNAMTYTVTAVATDEFGRETVGAPEMVVVPPPEDCELSTPMVKIDELLVCPSEGTVTVDYSVAANGGILYGLYIDMTMTYGDEKIQSLDGEERYEGSAVFEIPDAPDLLPAPYEVVVAARQELPGAVNPSIGTVVEVFEIDGRDDCFDPGPPTATPTPTTTPAIATPTPTPRPATPGPATPEPTTTAAPATPTPTTGVATPSPTPSPTPVVPVHITTPTPDPMKPLSYWDGEGPSSWTTRPMTPSDLGPITPEPSSSAETTQIAFTGTESVITLLTGLVIAHLGYAMATIGRKKSGH